MSISRLKITNFRNLSFIDINLHEKYNLFYGINGSGKTSLLEAIHCLSVGRSFRSHLLSRIIQYNAEKFSIFGEIKHNDGVISSGIERGNDTGTIKIGGEAVSSCAELAKLLPLQLINYNGYKLLEQAKFRRRFLDWVLFHVEHQFFALWKRLNRLIKQRNAALSDQNMNSNILIWNAELAQISMEIHILREQYANKLIDIIKSLIIKIFDNFEINIDYFRGWGSDSDLNFILNDSIEQDRSSGFTHFGAHRADLAFKAKNIPVHDGLSRGQQKILFFIISLAQGILFEQLTHKKCVYLIDDFSAELDDIKKQKIAEILENLNAQIFVTGLTSTELSEFFPNNYKMFHVEHGEIKHKKNS